jgi:hypothetical protein
MIAKYNGKCDLTATSIVANQTEIAKFGTATVLAEYATQEAIDAWFAAQVEEIAAMMSETSQLRGREFDRNSNPLFTEFVANLERRRTSKFSVLKADADFVRNEHANVARRLEGQRNR